MSSIEPVIKKKYCPRQLVFEYLCLLYFCFLVLDSGEFSTSGQGNIIRFYALQAVSAKVMRKVINNPPNAFRKKIEDVKKLCKSEKHCDKTWAKEFLSSNYVF